LTHVLQVRPRIKVLDLGRELRLDHGLEKETAAARSLDSPAVCGTNARRENEGGVRIFFMGNNRLS